MKVNFAFDQFLDLTGDTVLSFYADQEAKEADRKTNYTLELFALQALKKGTDKDNGERKFEDWELAQKIKTAPDKSAVEITAEEVARVKLLLGAYGSEVVGPAYRVLEGHSDPYGVTKK